MTLTRRPKLERHRAIAFLRSQLERQSSPRLQMLTILTIAGLAGSLTSALLLSLGLTDIPIRYAIAALAGYVTFLCSIKIWLARQREHHNRHPFDMGDLPAPDAYPTAINDFSFGGGGGYSGAGAEGAFDAPPIDAPDATAFDVIPDVDEGVGVLLPILVVVALLIGLVGAVAVLTGAPGLLAEVLLDGLIAGTAYGRLRDRDRRHWLDGVLRRTWKPMLAVIVVVVLIGAGIGLVEPGADRSATSFGPRPAQHGHQAVLRAYAARSALRGE